VSTLKTGNYKILVQKQEPDGKWWLSVAASEMRGVTADEAVERFVTVWRRSRDEEAERHQSWAGTRVTLACGHAFLREITGFEEPRIGGLYACYVCPPGQSSSPRKLLAVDVFGVFLSQPPQDWPSVWWGQ
jgi:hypothetical protein